MDTERKHTYEQAVHSYALLKIAYQDAGYHIVDVPKCSVDERVAFLVHDLRSL